MRLIDIPISIPWHGQATVNPEDANVILTRYNHGNRVVRKGLVEYLLRQILNGEWQPDHPQSIVFSPSRLIDGQHRLIAISKSGKTVTVTAKTGVRDELRQYIDTGIIRTLPDRLLFVDDPVRNAGIAQLVTSHFSMFDNRKRPTPEESKKLFAAHEEAMNWVVKYKLRHVRGLTQASVCLALMYMYETDPEDAEEFAESLMDPDGTIQPARRLREFLISKRGIAFGQSARNEIYARCVSCMKAYLEGREVGRVRAGQW